MKIDRYKETCSKYCSQDLQTTRYMCNNQNVEKDSSKSPKPRIYCDVQKFFLPCVEHVTKTK